MDITTRINNALVAVFNVEDDIYKAIICDKDGVPATPITIPTDFNIGVVASLIEYLRRLGIDLLKQMYIDEATGAFLKHILEKYFKTLRLADETEEEWIARTIQLVFKPRVSKAAIIVALRPFSSLEPEIELSEADAMFSNVSFADRYQNTVTTYNGKTFYVKPAIAQAFESIYFSIIIILTDTNPADFYTVVDLVKNYVAAGISYSIQIKET